MTVDVLVAPSALVIAVLTIPIWGSVRLWAKYGAKPYEAWRRRRRAIAAEKWYAQREALWEERHRNPPDPSTLKLLWLALVNFKKKICPIITFY